MLQKSLVVVCAACASLSLAAGAPLAQAASPSLTLATAADPTESITTQLLATGTASDKTTSLNATIKSTGGQGCAANPAADQSAGGRSIYFGEGNVAESFSLSRNETFSAAGSYLFCGWLNDSSLAGNPVVATASVIINVRPPHLTLAISAPASVLSGQLFQLVTTAQTEVSRNVIEDVIPNTGRGCPANASAAGVAAGVDHIEWPAHFGDYEWGVTGGPFSESVNDKITTAGLYLVCAYIEYPNLQSPPELTANATINVVSPPTPCKVPALLAGERLAAAKQAIGAAGCAVGAIRRVASRRVRAGYVISFSRAAATMLPAGSLITITVSTGPPCIVPFVSPGTSLGRTELRLLANHCAVGKVSSARSRHIRRGRVLRLGARTGQVLPSHAPVSILIARRGR